MSSSSSNRKVIGISLFGIDEDDDFFGSVCNREATYFCELFKKMGNCSYIKTHESVEAFLSDIIQSSSKAATVVAFYAGHGDDGVVQRDSKNVSYDYLFKRIRKELNPECTLILVLGCCFAGSSFHSANKHFQDDDAPKILIQAVGSTYEVDLQSQADRGSSENKKVSEFFYSFFTRNLKLNFPEVDVPRINFTKGNNQHQPRIWINFKAKSEYVYIDLGGGHRLSLIDKWGTGSKRSSKKYYEDSEDDEDESDDGEYDDESDYGEDESDDEIAEMLKSLDISSDKPNKPLAPSSKSSSSKKPGKKQ